MKTLVVLSILILSSVSAFAHPGRTANDGCHYCRTNCAYWGVPQGQRHCHYMPSPERLEDGVLKVSAPGWQAEAHDPHRFQEGHVEIHGEKHSHGELPQHSH